MDNTTTSFFGDNTIVYNLTVYSNQVNVADKYDYKTLKVLSGVQDPVDFTTIYVSPENDKVPLPTLLKRL